MAEYIEREALLSQIKTYEAFDFTIKEAVLAVERTSAADVVKVVRCRDCRYISVPTERGNFLCGHKMLGLVRPDDFCSFGERMDGE